MSGRTRRHAGDPFDVRVGDTWVFLTNTGGIHRTITMIGSKFLEYRELASGTKHVCLISTFKRWWRGACLEYRIPDPMPQEGGEG